MIKFDLIQKRMTEKGITQTELAKQANLSRATVCYLVNGKTEDVRLPTLQAIADALDVSLRDLFEEKRAA